MSLPHLVGGEGILDTILLPLTLSEEEQTALGRSARTIKQAYKELNSTT
jgi:malate/lactate dehydrogenase